MITRFLHARIRVNDLEKSMAFYRDVLGLKQGNLWKSPEGMTLVFFLVPVGDETVEIEICHEPDAPPVVVPPNFAHLAFQVENLEAFTKFSTSKGYPIFDGPYDTGWGQIFSYLKAPDGHVIEVIEKYTHTRTA